MHMFLRNTFFPSKYGFRYCYGSKLLFVLMEGYVGMYLVWRLMRAPKLRWKNTAEEIAKPTLHHTLREPSYKEMGPEKMKLRLGFVVYNWTSQWLLWWQILKWTVPVLLTVRLGAGKCSPLQFLLVKASKSRQGWRGWRNIFDLSPWD